MDTQVIAYAFSPDKTISQVTNVIRAQVAGKGLEKDFVLRSLASKAKFEELSYGLGLLLDQVVYPYNRNHLVYALIYLDGTGHGQSSLNDLLAKAGMTNLGGPVSYTPD
jgi:hypothetical protein